jgi:hypothetical protein
MIRVSPMTCRRKAIPPLFRVVAAGAAALVLMLTILAVCPSLHAWLHGEKHLDADDDCAVVLFIQGVTPALAAVAVAAATLRFLADRLPVPAPLHLTARHFEFPPGCGPPSG